jgi:hypothetical protein
MTTVSGVFRSKEQADRAALSLRQTGVQEVNQIAPGEAAKADSVATTPTEQPGMGKAVGGVLGAALGIAGGWEAGVAVASVMLPGVGPVVAAGVVAATLLGAGGALGGAAAGEALEEETTNGLPEDELYVYKDALRQGKTVVFVQARDSGEAAQAREILQNAGAEAIDAARDEWWIGLRSAEKEHYQNLGHDFGRDEAAYRRGFEAALRSGEANDHPSPSEGTAYRRGYDRGRAYRNGK